MENVINEMAENVKGLKSDVDAKIEEVKSSIKVGADEMQKQIDAQNVAQKKAASKQVKFMDEAIQEKLDGNMDLMEKEMKSGGKFRLDLSDVKTMTLSGSLTEIGRAHV